MISRLFAGNSQDSERRLLWVAVLLMMVTGSSAWASDRVDVRGEVDKSGHNYRWAVTNRDDSPIVAVEFDHYRGDTCVPPGDWEQEFTNKHSIDSEAGLCRGSTTKANGIRKGESEVFQLRINARGAPVGEGVVRISFADGSQVSVVSVMPVKPSSIVERYGTLVGMGGLVGVFVLFRFLKSVISRNKREGIDSD